MFLRRKTLLECAKRPHCLALRQRPLLDSHQLRFAPTSSPATSSFPAGLRHAHGGPAKTSLHRRCRLHNSILDFNRFPANRSTCLRAGVGCQQNSNSSSYAHTRQETHHARAPRRLAPQSISCCCHAMNCFVVPVTGFVSDRANPVLQKIANLSPNFRLGQQYP